MASGKSGKDGGHSQAQVNAPQRFTATSLPAAPLNPSQAIPAQGVVEQHLRRSSNLWSLFIKTTKRVRDDLDTMSALDATAALQRLANVHSTLVRTDRASLGLDKGVDAGALPGVIAVPVKSASPEDWRNAVRAYLEAQDGAGDGAAAGRGANALRGLVQSPGAEEDAPGGDRG